MVDSRNGRTPHLTSGDEKSLLIVGNFLSHRVGTRGSCEELASRLPELGWDVVSASRRYNRLARFADMVKTAWRLRDRYRVAQIDVFSGPSFIWAETMSRLLTRAGKPFVLSLRGGALPAFSRRWPRRVRRLLQSATVVTSPSPYVLRELSDFRSDLRWVRNSLAISDYEYKYRPNPTPHLVWLRAFHFVYNPVLAPRVIALLAPEFPDIQMTMIGPDKGDGSLQELRRVAKELGVEDRIRIEGFIPKSHVSNWIGKGDIFVNSTNVDSAPVTVLEAMACGLCIVSTNVGGVPFMVEDGRDALLVPPDDEQAMAQAIRRLLTEEGLAGRLSANARAKAESYDWPGVLRVWDEILTEAMRSGAIPEYALDNEDRER